MHYVKVIPVIWIDFLTPQQLKLLLYMKSHKHKGQYVKLSINETASRLGMSNRTIKKCLDVLLELGIIKEQFSFKRSRQQDGTYTYMAPLYSIHDMTTAKKFEWAFRNMVEGTNQNYRDLVVEKSKLKNKRK